uniref:Uncharacterized protein n=1 Tax=Ditylenchus dipsaci TaxID=166011 RepID=A0A915E214_9BILA
MPDRVLNGFDREYFKKDGKWFNTLQYISSLYLHPSSAPGSLAVEQVPPEFIQAEEQNGCLEDDNDVIWLPNVLDQMAPRLLKKRSSNEVTKYIKSEQQSNSHRGHSSSVPNLIPRKTLSAKSGSGAKLEDLEETTQLAKYANKEQVIEGQVAVVELSMRRPGRRNAFQKPDKKLINFLLDRCMEEISDDEGDLEDSSIERKIYLDATGDCIYCFAHSAPPHNLVKQCHIRYASAPMLWTRPG